MPTTSHWIQRKVADEIYKRIITSDSNLAVYLVEAPAGMGKTYLARDLGVRLGSPTGYELAKKERILWSSIMDLYDPDTNSNPGIEKRILQAFPVDEFGEYFAERSIYDTYFKGGITGSGLEEQRTKVEQAFALGLQNVSKLYRPVLVFDTIERLERAADPAQQEFGIFEDTASVTGWLQYQISQLSQGVILLLGRKAERFHKSLKETIEKANKERAGKGQIELFYTKMGKLDEDEQKDFFANRQEHHAALRSFLDEELIQLLFEHAEGNPLLLDIALQSLLETGDPNKVKEILKAGGGLKNVQSSLIGAYMNDFTRPQRQTLLYYLALCRNGLSKELLAYFEPDRSEGLFAELVEMGNLPFVKVREVSGTQTYFLHDAMYTICDEVLLRPAQAASDSQKIVEWYDNQLKLTSDPAQIADLLDSSLFYRMRADPLQGYQWYLQHADQAIRTAQTSLDMRLRDALGIFLASASSEEDDEPGQSLSSPIDRGNVEALMPDLFDRFRLDSITLWIKRYSLRGKHEKITQIQKEILYFVKNAYQKDQENSRWAYAEFLLWYGQTVMYGFEIDKALEYYEQVLHLIRKTYPEENLDAQDLDDFTRWRLTLILGRTYNNIGYTHMIYRGQYLSAIREFQKAIRLFRTTPTLEEELANSSDNMGRAYSNLGLEFQALQLIQNGIIVREKLGLQYREALSRNTLAHARIRFRQYDLARNAVEDALRQFRTVGSERGIGIGLLTHGAVYRNLADSWRELEIPAETAIDYTFTAEVDLREATRIFQHVVFEPIRQVQAHNEMACCYRARYQLLTHTNAPESNRTLAFDQAQSQFQYAITLAHKHQYLIEELDSKQDLAVLMMRSRRLEKAIDLLDQVDHSIPEEYKIKLGEGLIELNENEIVDAFYKLMGQVEMLRGAIGYEQGKLAAKQQGEKGDQPTHEAWLETARFYLFAMTYFDRYSGEPFAHQQTYARMHLRFKDCPSELGRHITEKCLPEWANTYKLPEELIGGSFRDVFGLFK